METRNTDFEYEYGVNEMNNDIIESIRNSEGFQELFEDFTAFLSESVKRLKEN